MTGRLVALLDGKPGHARQTQALAAALAEAHGLAVTAIDVVPRRPSHDRLRAALVKAPLPPAMALRLGYRLDPATLPAADHVIASGRPTIAAGILIARLSGARFLYVGRALHYDWRDFAGVLVHDPAAADRPRHALAPIPSPVRARGLPPPRPVVASGGAEVALLLGGPSHSHRYEEAEWAALAGAVAELARRGWRWSVATSRRTPASAARLFAALATDGALARFVDFAAAGPGSADPLFAADALVVTGDSMSMIAEASAALRPVVVLRPSRVKPSADDAMLAAMERDDGVTVVPFAGLSADSLAAALVAARPAREDPSLRLLCAASAALGLDPA
jgi:hypothetical protein